MRILKVIFCLLCWMPSGVSLAFEDDSRFTVQGIKVDVKSDSAVAAKNKAIADGQRRALKVLLSRLAPSEESSAAIENLSDEKIADLVINHEFEDQKISSVRFIATMTFRFNAKSIARFLGDKSLQITEQPQAPLVVLPVLVLGGQPYLWEEENIWLQAWLQRQNFGGNTPLTLPMGDLNDLKNVNAHQALESESEPLNALVRRYGGRGALIAIAQVARMDDRPQMDLSLNIVTLDGQIQTPELAPFNPEDVSGNKLLQEAIDHLISAVEGNAKKSVADNTRTTQRLIMHTPISDLAQWIRIERTLKALPITTKVRSLSRNAAKIEVTYSGSPQELESRLNGRGLSLVQSGPNSWILSENSYGSFR